MRINGRANVLILFATATLLAGCLTGGEADEASTDSPTDPSGNNPPTITGSPNGSVLVGEMFSFVPSASDPDGDSLVFSVENKPRWASFDTGDGSLSGTPNLGDEGTYSNIRISVSDGNSQASLPRFDVAVTQAADGSTTLTWTAPTQNSDGSALTDLAGYKIYYGTSQGNYTKQIRIDNPGITSYVVDNLSPNTYYFVSTAFNSTGIESDYSNVAIKTVN